MPHLRIAVEYARDEERTHAIAEALRTAGSLVTALGLRPDDVFIAFADRAHTEAHAELFIEGHVPSDGLRPEIATTIAYAFLAAIPAPTRTVHVFVRKAHARDGGFAAGEAFVFTK